MATTQLPSVADLAAQLTALSDRLTELTQWQVSHEDRHQALENQVVATASGLDSLRTDFASLQSPLSLLEAYVGRVANDGTVAAQTLVSRVVNLEQSVTLEGSGLHARVNGLEQLIQSVSAQVPGALSASAPSANVSPSGLE